MQGFLVWGFLCMVKAVLGSPGPSLPATLLPWSPTAFARRLVGLGGRSCRSFLSQAADIQCPPAGPSPCSRAWDQRKPWVACWPCSPLSEPSSVLLSSQCHRLSRHRLQQEPQPRCSPGEAVCWSAGRPQGRDSGPLGHLAPAVSEAGGQPTSLLGLWQGCSELEVGKH